MGTRALPVRVVVGSALSLERLSKLPRSAYAGPLLCIDRGIITKKYREFQRAFPGFEMHYAVKCNPHAGVIEHIKNLGGSFEIASFAELALLMQSGVSARDVLYSNPVKSADNIRRTYDAGVRCFAFQSEDELGKLAAIGAPDINVYLRLSTPPGDSTVASEAKFGQRAGSDDEQRAAVSLLQRAARLGLKPYGLAFHVGSQMERAGAWDAPLQQVSWLLKLLQASGIHLTMLDLGGGFPAYHGTHIPPLRAFGKAINAAIAQLPYRPERIVLEPGRALVSDAGAMVAEVYGKAWRDGRWWLYLNVGAFNGFMEALETRTALQYPMADSRAAKRQVPYVIVGPSCDSQDTISSEQFLSEDLAAGDTVVIYTAGAYTTAYASRFNGFVPPTVLYVG